MAVHASLGRRNPGNGGSFHARMTVAAIDAVIAHVMLVAELQGLLTGNVLSRHIGRARHREHGYERHSNKKDRPSKRNVSIKSDVYGVPFAIPLGSPPSTDSHAKRNHFPRNFRAVSVGRHWRFFSPIGHLPPQPERVHTASKMRS